MAIAADLNRVGKRPRSSSDAQAATPGKRRHVENEIGKQTPAVLTSTSRKSVTSLRSRRGLPISSPVARPHGPEVYDTPESPENSGKNKRSPAKPQAEKETPVKKGAKRKLNRKTDKESTNNSKSFDPRRRSAFNPLLVAGVKLTTEDSPGKNTRAKRQGPLKKLDTNYVRVVPVNAEAGREASPELGAATPIEVPFTSGQQEQEQDQDEVESNDGSERQPQGEALDLEDGAATETETRKKDGRQKSTVRPNNTGESEQTDHEMPRQQVTDQDRNYIMRTYEATVRKRGDQGIKNKASPRGQMVVSHSTPKKAREKQKQPSKNPVIRREPSEEDEVPDTNGGEVSAEASKMKKGRKKMSEEERRAKVEEKARVRQENARETEAAEIRNLDAYGKDFIAGIENIVADVGGLTAWSNMGAGAKTITEMVAKKSQMDNARAQALWKKLSALRAIFSGNEEASEERVDHLINTLQAKSTRQVLTRDEQTRSEDTTIVELYEHIIPLSVCVLKEQLSGSFVSSHLATWRELRSIIETAINICEVATDWDPKPTTLEAGIRRQVRQNIRPSLTMIHSAVKNTVTAMEYKERKDLELAAFTKRQQMKREEKRKMWERLNRDDPAKRQSSEPVNDFPSHTASQTGHKDFDGDYIRHAQGPVSHSSNRTAPPPPLRRRPTEEIPAPDPNTNWNEKENVALLNGLQKYLGQDRYDMILGDPKFAKVLRGKDVEQCMGRAVFFQAGCSQILKEKAATGDSSFDWLRSV